MVGADETTELWLISNHFVVSIPHWMDTIGNFWSLVFRLTQSFLVKKTFKECVLNPRRHSNPGPQDGWKVQTNLLSCGFALKMSLFPSLSVWPDKGVKCCPNRCHSSFTLSETFQNSPKKSPMFWAAFANKFVANNFQKSPNHTVPYQIIVRPIKPALISPTFVAVKREERINWKRI